MMRSIIPWRGFVPNPNLPIVKQLASVSSVQPLIEYCYASLADTLESAQATFSVLARIDEVRVVQGELNSTMDDVVNGLDAEHKAVQ